MFKTEAQLQAECIRQYRDKHPEYRELLFSNNNNAIGGVRGSIEMAKGRVAGVFDLTHISFNWSGKTIYIEMKLPGAKHNTTELIKQINWAKNVMSVNDNIICLYCFSVSGFWDIITKCKGMSVDAFEEIYNVYNRKSVVIYG